MKDQLTCLVAKMETKHLKEWGIRLQRKARVFIDGLCARVGANRTSVATALVGIFLLVASLYIGVIQAPSSFPQGKVVRIEEGQTLNDVATLLKDRGVVRSSFWFKNIAILLGDQRGVIAGDYFFTRDRNLFEVTHMVMDGNFGLEPIKVTIPEGASVKEIAIILSNRFNIFDPVRFMELASEKEGYLFPDTYYFLPNISEASVVRVLEETFSHKLEELQPKIEAFGRPLGEVITMASIIEREARTPESRRLISGILWKRIEIGMPLQVDVTFDYINGKNSFTLTKTDLAVDSPYNTYVYDGLPPGPIANPSLDSIDAAITPTESDYLYFLADRQGVVHYSATFEEHRRKKFLYLN